jgi:hypothetical protein
LSSTTKDNLDKALKEHFLDEWGPEGLVIITHWTIVAAGLDRDGDPEIMNEDSDEKMPVWQTRGLLHEGIKNLKYEYGGD